MNTKLSEKKKTQAELIEEYLDEFGMISPLEALREIGCFRLAARIGEIKEHRDDIRKRMVEVTTKRGGKARIAEYYLVREPGEAFTVNDQRPLW